MRESSTWGIGIAYRVSEWRNANRAAYGGAAFAVLSAHFWYRGQWVNGLGHLRIIAAAELFGCLSVIFMRDF